MNRDKPSMDLWIQEAKSAIHAEKIGMYLFHNGVVRATPRAQVREGQADLPHVEKIFFSYDAALVEEAIRETQALEGIYYVRVWLNFGELRVGEDIMYVLIGGDIRPRVTYALDQLVGKLKSLCVKEREIYQEI